MIFLHPQRSVTLTTWPQEPKKASATCVHIDEPGCEPGDWPCHDVGTIEIDPVAAAILAAYIREQGLPDLIELVEPGNVGPFNNRGWRHWRAFWRDEHGNLELRLEQNPDPTQQGAP